MATKSPKKATKAPYPPFPLTAEVRRDYGRLVLGPILALKRVLEYREAYAKVVAKHGAEVVKAARALLGERDRDRGYVADVGLNLVNDAACDLGALLELVAGYGLSAPPDPDDPEDFGNPAPPRGTEAVREAGDRELECEVERRGIALSRALASTLPGGPSMPNEVLPSEGSAVVYLCVDLSFSMEEIDKSIRTIKINRYRIRTSKMPANGRSFKETIKDFDAYDAWQAGVRPSGIELDAEERKIHRARARANKLIGEAGAGFQRLLTQVGGHENSSFWFCAPSGPAKESP